MKVGSIVVLVIGIIAVIISLGIWWLTVRHHQKNHNPESSFPRNYEEFNKISAQLQEKLPVLNNQVESISQTLQAQATLLPVVESKLDSLHHTTATEISVKLLKENLAKLELLTNKLDKKTETIEIKTDQNAMIEQQQIHKVNDNLNAIASIDQAIATNLQVSMNQTKMIPTLDTKVETIKQHTSDINSIKETLNNLNNLIDGLNKMTTAISSQSNQNNEQNRRQLGDVQEKINELTKIFINDRNRGRSAEFVLEQFLSKYFGVKGEKRLWATQYKVTSLNNPKQEIGLVDAIIFTPHQGQNIAIDAKFPTLDYGNIFTETGKINPVAKKEFENKIKSKVKDLKKYIHPDNQIASVIMFIPSESIYYFIAEQCPETMDYAYRENIWLAGPTILMTILNSQSQVVRDHYFVRDINRIKDLIISLKSEFSRFDERADKLKVVYDRYVKDTDNAFKSLQTTQHKISNKVEKLESFDEEITAVERLGKPEPNRELPPSSVVTVNA